MAEELSYDQTSAVLRLPANGGGWTPIHLSIHRVATGRRRLRRTGHPAPAHTRGTHRCRPAAPPLSNHEPGYESPEMMCEEMKKTVRQAALRNPASRRAQTSGDEIGRWLLVGAGDVSQSSRDGLSGAIGNDIRRETNPR